MSGTSISRHAQVRQQQRAIPRLILGWLLTYGAVRRSHEGSQIRYFNHKARRRVAAEVGHQVVDRLAPLLNAYMVVSANGTVITCGHRYRSIGNQ